MIAPRSARATAALAVACLGVGACGDGGGAARPPPAFTECRLPRLPVAAQCGTLEVPENRDAPHGRAITLTVAVLRANTLSPRPDPLFMLAGGPGQAATFLGPLAAQMINVRKDRDIILVDQRGTGRSSPLACRALRQDDALATALDIEIVPRAAECAKELAELGIDPAQYTTAAWVEDLDAVRAALGYAKINLWGGSYGTRVALEYLRRHPDHVRSAVLDGVAPPAMMVSFDVWPARDRAIDRVIESCEGSPACRSAHPDLATTLDSIRARLGTSGRDVAVANPRTGATETLHITFDHVVAALQTLTYAPELAALIPEAIARVAAGDYGPLFAAALLVSGNLTEQMNVALHYSVTCAEDAPRLASGRARSALEGARSQGLARRLLAVCDVWPHGSAPLDAMTPVNSDVPVLILSGALDPVTPPSNGAEVARTLTHSRHIVARGFGHIVSSRACAPRLIASFLDDPTFASLPETCVERFESSDAPAPWPDRLGAR
jgi:pimeloyl-ACP methyl ester carboxylesterase